MCVEVPDMADELGPKGCILWFMVSRLEVDDRFSMSNHRRVPCVLVECVQLSYSAMYLRLGDWETETARPQWLISALQCPLQGNSATSL